MRKSALVLSIIGAVFCLFCFIGGAVLSCYITESYLKAVTFENLIVFEVEMISLWIGTILMLFPITIHIVTAVTSSKAKTKQVVYSPAIYSIIFGGIFGIIAGILLLATPESEFSDRH